VVSGRQVIIVESRTVDPELYAALFSAVLFDVVRVRVRATDPGIADYWVVALFDLGIMLRILPLDDDHPDETLRMNIPSPDGAGSIWLDGATSVCEALSGLISAFPITVFRDNSGNAGPL
jgi:hypothetical protein